MWECQGDVATVVDDGIDVVDLYVEDDTLMMGMMNQEMEMEEQVEKREGESYMGVTQQQIRHGGRREGE